ncbi:hypothetical protein FN846DRAFT_906539 [Sphaerosporella brunnea]|uniref:Uncharacterized protein n=1 Tax=Sphaerosporella brunnea TaxID=1250544 RepID=A0A5J5EY60_9PEZI|nr:hypothetical protein FN846DRAFT_906539 [Sphaerosporella brunnea]
MAHRIPPGRNQVPVAPEFQSTVLYRPLGQMHLSHKVLEFLARMRNGQTIQTCLQDLGTYNLIRVLLHCNRGFRHPNNLPTGGVDMPALHSVPCFWWGFFEMQWTDSPRMFAWMAAIENIWLVDARGFFGCEVPPGRQVSQSVNLVAVIIRYMPTGNAGRPSPRSVNFRSSQELANTQRDWRAMEGHLGVPVVVTVLPGKRDFCILYGRIQARGGALRLRRGHAWRPKPPVLGTANYVGSNKEADDAELFGIAASLKLALHWLREMTTSTTATSTGTIRVTGSVDRPQDRDVPGNEQADKVAKGAASSQSPSKAPEVLATTSLAYMARASTEAKRQDRDRWLAEHCRSKSIGGTLLSAATAENFDRPVSTSDRTTCERQVLVVPAETVADAEPPVQDVSTVARRADNPVGDGGRGDAQSGQAEAENEHDGQGPSG